MVIVTNTHTRTLQLAFAVIDTSRSLYAFLAAQNTPFFFLKKTPVTHIRIAHFITVPKRLSPIHSFLKLTSFFFSYLILIQFNLPLRVYRCYSSKSHSIKIVFHKVFFFYINPNGRCQYYR